MQFIIKSEKSVVCQGWKFNPKQDEQVGIASGQMESAFREYSQKFKGCAVELDWQDDQGLWSLPVDTYNF